VAHTPVLRVWVSPLVELLPVLPEKFLELELALVLARFTLRHIPVNSTRKNHLFSGQLRQHR